MIDIGPRTRTALFVDMRAFLLEEIRKRGLKPDDPKLFSMPVIEETALRLADNFIGEARDYFVDVGDTAAMLAAGEPAPVLVAKYISKERASFKAAYLSDALGGLDSLIALASIPAAS